VIVAVEGPSAAGKTTWIRRVAPHLEVAEHRALRPPAGDVTGVAAFWTSANAQRWHAALQTEAAAGAALCDTDPLKLHYEFCLVRIGLGTLDGLRAGVIACRAAIVDGALGLVDLVICNVPDEATLIHHRDTDHGRQRRNFDVHRRLGPPLVEWYSALEQLDRGRVMWGFPEALPNAPRRDRYDLDLYDAWMALLGIA
jgi:hypothetical protein